MGDADLAETPNAPTTIEDLRDAIIAAVPQLAVVPMLVKSSASANLRRSDTGEILRGLTGARIYILVRNAAENPQIGARICQHLKLAGRGFGFVSHAGHVFVRTLLDESVWSPERLDFASGAECVPPVVQNPVCQRWNDGAAPLELVHLPPLTAAELSRLSTVEAQIRLAAEPRAKAQREKYRAEREAAGYQVRATWASGAVEFLNGDHTIVLKDNSAVTVNEVAAAGKDYHRAYCADPMEPDYGGNDHRIAQIFVNDDGPIVINSNAHGGLTYICRPSPHIAAQMDFDVVTVDDESLDADTPPSARTALARFNREYALVEDVANAVLFTPPDGAPYKLLPLAHWRTLTHNRTVIVDTEKGSRKQRLSEMWLQSKRRRLFKALVNEPALPPMTSVPASHGGENFNVWSGLALTPSETGACDLFLSHIRDIVCQGNEAAYRWVMSWLASCVQRPDRLPGTALVLRGAQGAGKSVVYDVMREILGERLAASVSKIEELIGRFNLVHENRVLIGVEEAIWAGDRSVIGPLKHIITSPHVLIERKGIDSYQLRNTAHLLITSNEQFIVPAGRGERRYMVLDVSDAPANDRAYFTALRSQMFDRGGCACLLHHLLREITIDWDLIARPLPTAALRDQQIAALEPGSRWLLDILQEGELPGDSRGMGESHTGTLFKHYEIFVRKEGARRVTTGDLTKLLKPMGVEKIRCRVDGGFGRVYRFPALADCRKRFARDLALSPDWEGEDWVGDPILAEVLP